MLKKNNSNFVIFQQLKAQTKLAYSPYSNVRVGCLIEDRKGQRAWGVNVENLSYGLTVCAEQTAIGNLITKFGIVEITKIYLFSPQTDFILPCGRCRQVLIEHQKHQNKTKVITFNRIGTNKQYFLKDLIPNNFTINRNSN